jgi:hypothetical protein
VILLLTYVVALARLPHIIAGSVEASFAVITGHADVSDYLLRFLLPTLIGNTIGGVALVGFLNHAPLAPELQGEAEDNELGRQSARSSKAAKSSKKSRARARKE